MVFAREWIEGLSRAGLKLLLDSIDVGRDDLEDLLLLLLEGSADGLQIQQCVPPMHFLEQLQWLAGGLGRRENVLLEVGAEGEGLGLQDIEEDLLGLVPAASKDCVGGEGDCIGEEILHLGQVDVQCNAFLDEADLVE